MVDPILWLPVPEGNWLLGLCLIEIAIQKTEGFSFAQLRETYVLGSQCAFEHGREIAVRDVVEAVELQMAGAYDLKTSVAASGFVKHSERTASRK